MDRPALPAYTGQVGPRGRRALLLGWRGGVGSAVTQLLADHPTGQSIAAELDCLILVDRVEADAAPVVGARVLSGVAVDSPDELAALVTEHRVDQVIEVAEVDTFGCVAACARCGADSLTSSLHGGPHGSQLTADLARSLVPGKRPALPGSHLIGAGMNPGVVNALVFAGLHELADRVGGRPDAEALDLYAVYITERDTTRPARADVPKDVFAVSWSPSDCLDELFEPQAVASMDGQPEPLGHPPTARRYAVHCGDEEIAGMAVPHEEVVTLGDRFPGLECAFLYELPAAAERALARGEGRSIDEWRTHRLYPPDESELIGHDRVGVLLCSRSHGELWIGYDTPVSAGRHYRTNATQLQVAAGVLAGWRMLGSQPGIHVVEELDWRIYLDRVSHILGRPVVHYHPDARPRRLRDRVSATDRRITER